MRELLKHEQAYAEYSGEQWEAENAPPVKEPARLEKGKYIPYKEAMQKDNWELVKKNQTTKPEIPPSTFTRRLQSAICERLAKYGMPKSDELLYYSAAKSALDQHGVDAWFEFDGARAEIDYTVNEQGKGEGTPGYKSELIFPKHKDLPGEFENLANRITETLIAKRDEILRKRAAENRPLRLSRRDRFRI